MRSTDSPLFSIVLRLITTKWLIAPWKAVPLPALQVFAPVCSISRQGEEEI